MTDSAHSSHTRSGTGLKAQTPDALNDIPVSLDPNISGTAPTEDTYTWQAGKMSAWAENDDYRHFFEANNVAESRTTHQYDTVHDGDYDDNGGHPTGIGHVRGIHGPVESGTGEPTLPSGHSPFAISPVIRGRL